jgi:hypothetical protein
VWCVLVLAALSVTKSASAQAGAVGIGRASLALSAGFVVPTRLDLRQPASLRIVAVSDGETEYELELVAAANVSWRLVLASPFVDRAGGDVATAVRDDMGVWHSMQPGGAPIVVVGERGPCNPTVVAVRLRVRAQGSSILDPPRFTMGTALAAAP